MKTTSTPREPGARLDVDRDAARAVAHLDAAVGVQDDVDARAVAAEGLVDGVVDDLPEAVHEAAGVGRADVHAGALADRFEPLEHLEMVGGILGGHNPQAYPRAATRTALTRSGRAARTRSAKCHRFAAFSKQSRGCISDTAHGVLHITRRHRDEHAFDTDRAAAVVLEHRLSAVDRCDSCGAQAYIAAEVNGSELLFCAHHGRKYEEKLRAIATSWHDETARLIES